MKLSSWNVNCLLLLIVSVVLSACATGSGGKVKGSPFAFLNSYDMALQDFEAGKVMEARARVLAMDASRDDYKKAKALLNDKINPARIRLLRHYKSKGKKAEQDGEWSKAMAFYQQTAEFSAEPEIFLAYVKNMDIKMRQARMDILLKQKRLEDSSWLSWLGSYEAPRGVEPTDIVFVRMREAVESDIEDRAARAYRESYRFLNKDMPGVAYVEVESHLRLMPDSEKGQRLLQDVLEAMPKELIIKKEISKTSAKKVTKQASKSKLKKTSHISKADVMKLIEAGEWIEAKNTALLYRRYEGKGADKLLDTIESGMAKEAAVLFAQGSTAFRKEHIDQAVSLWDKAVTLQPENSEYVNALRRAMQLQERLHLLRSDGK